jgi:uncharacterized protein YihD (DUF1040 family)
MELDKVIAQMENNDGQTKVASQQAAPVATPNLSAALEKAAGVPVQDADAIDVLMKTANELAGTEKEADVAHAALCGQAFADGAIAKLAAYDAQVQQLALQETKVAAYIPEGMSKVAAASMELNDEEIVKLASEVGYQTTMNELMGGMSKVAAASMELSDDEIVKLASEVGYQTTVEALGGEEMSKVAAATADMSDDEVVKLASEVGYQHTIEKIAEEYNEGHNDALQQVHDQAAGEFLKGAAETETLLNMLGGQ